MRRRRTATTILAALLLFAGGRAHAQPEDRRAAAQALFEQGRALVAAKNFKEACPKLAESMRIDPGIGTSLWLADCYENNGQTASAWAQFKEAAAQAAMQKDPRERVARSRAEHLEKQLARLLIVVDAKTKTPELTITRDGIAVGDAELGNPLPVDPGPHEVTAAAPGRKPWKTSVTIAPRAATTSVTIPPLDPDGTSSKVTPPPPPPPDDHTTPPPSESTGSTQRLIGLVVAGVGVAGAGVGTYFAFHAKSTYDSSSDLGHCLADNRCDAAGTQRRHDASTQATVATIAIGVGAAAIVAGAVLYFTAPSSRAVKVDGQSLSFRF